MNVVMMIGRLTKDPEMRFGQSGKAVCRFTLAVDREKKGEADFVPCVVFDKQAEIVDRYKKKGDQVAITGRIQTGSYTNKDGAKVYTTDVIVNRVEFIGGQQNADIPQAQAQPQQNGRQQADEFGQGGFFTNVEEDIPW